MRNLAAAAAAAALGVAASPATPEADPCAAADRGVSFFVLLENSTSGIYDACLDELRDKVARARLRARILQGQAARLEAEARSWKASGLPPPGGSRRPTSGKRRRSGG